MANAVDILSKSLSVARLRVNVLSSNMANAETTRTDEGGPYKRKDVMQVAKTVEDFSSTMDKVQLAEPAVLAVVEDQSPPRMVFEPGHPDANPEGYVAYPNINIVSTMTDLMTATRLYQANAAAIENIRTMEREAKSLSSNL